MSQTNHEPRTLRPAIIEQKPSVLKSHLHSSNLQGNGANNGRNFSVNRNGGNFIGHTGIRQNSTSFIQKDARGGNKSVIHPSLNGTRTASLYSGHGPSQTRHESVIDFKINQKRQRTESMNNGKSIHTKARMSVAAISNRQPSVGSNNQVPAKKTNQVPHKHARLGKNAVGATGPPG